MNALPAFKRLRLIRAFIAIVVAMCVSGCAHETLPSEPPIDYNAYDKIRLNVATVVFDDATQAHPVPGDISQRAPMPPVTALREMIAHRLKAVGTGGTAKVTVLTASIQHAPVSTLIGRMALRIDIITPSSNTAGYAVARVHRTAYTGHASSESAVALGNMTTLLTRDMNGALQDQITQVLGDWLVDASGMPLRNTVAQTDLSHAVTPASPPGKTMQRLDDVGQTPVAVTIVTPPTQKKPPSPGTNGYTRSPDALFPLGQEDASSSDARTSQPTKNVSPPPQFLSLPNHRGQE